MKGHDEQTRLYGTTIWFVRGDEALELSESRIGSSLKASIRERHMIWILDLGTEGIIGEVYSCRFIADGNLSIYRR